MLSKTVNNSPYPSGQIILPISIIIGMDPCFTISVLRQYYIERIVTLIDAFCQDNFIQLNTKNLFVEKHQLFSKTVDKNRERIRKAASKGVFPNFTEGDFVLVAQKDFSKREIVL